MMSPSSTKGQPEKLMPRPLGLRQGLAQLYQETLLCDATIVADGQSFPCHRVLLAAISPFFLDVFTSSTSKESDRGEVLLQDVSPSVVQSILKYIYTGEIALTLEGAPALFAGASHLQIIPLQDICCRFLVKNLSLQNCFGMYSLAQAHKSRSLRHAALHLLTVNFERTSEEEQFLQLDLSTLTALLASNHLAAASELKVYQAVRRWVQVQPSERRPLLGELMTHVRLPLFSAEEQAELQRDLEQWGDLHLEWKQMDGVERMRCSRGLRRDMYKSHILCVDTQLCDFRQLETEEAHMGCYDPEAGTWEKLPGLPFLTHAGCTAVGHKVYVSGGICKNSYSSALYEFDSFSGHWVEHPCMAVTRTAHAFLFCSQRLFAAGGWCKFQSFISSAESFDLKSGKWSSISRLPFALSHSAASVFRKRLYLLGGATDASGHWCFHSGYLTYDIGSDLWTEVSLGTGFFAAGAVAVDNGIYVIGGYSEKKTRNWVEGNLTPENRHCTRKCFFISEAGRVSHSSGIPKLPRGIANAGVVCSGNQIYVLGGEDLTQRYKTIYHWEPGEARWHRCATNIPTPHEGISRFGCAALMRPKPHILQLFQNTSQVLVAAVIK